ncbi:hypothetical protein L6164_020817 [Bauhinia variegata]|uniref:Uncharacterized protein n=1 Tax=Bauhinia variegata TaxID=167791 RepID=A0ACB9MYA3_BAUVA|nr:hypothetical protein L6164_020817 [Bauhinia variegata]
MNLASFSAGSCLNFTPNIWPSSFIRKEPNYKICCLLKRVNSDPTSEPNSQFRAPNSLEPIEPCLCGRRHLIRAASVAASRFPIRPSNATNSPSDYEVVVEKFHPPRADWYEELYASVLNSAMKSYEAEVARYKSQVFSDLRGNAQKVLEIGIGTGPNLKYYANDSDTQVIGIDPNAKMEKYALKSAESAGLPLSNFKFIHAVGEVIPLQDASVDAVVGTLVLCSVKDIEMTLKEMKRVLRPGGLYAFVEHVAAKDGTLLRFVQRVLDPLQQILSDGCHLCRQTGKSISSAGFSSVELNTASLSTAAFVNPHVYGIARK